MSKTYNPYTISFDTKQLLEYTDGYDLYEAAKMVAGDVLNISYVSGILAESRMKGVTEVQGVLKNDIICGEGNLDEQNDD